MKKKGFTLIELLATIIILALIGLIVYPTLNSVINGNKEKLHNKQMEELVRLTDTYSAQNMDKLKTLDGARNIVSFNDLYKSGLIKSDEVIDPATNERLTGCMSLTWKSSINGFDIKYIEDCNNSFSLSGKVTVTDPYSGTKAGIDNKNPKVQLLQGDKVMYETVAADDGSYSFNDVEGGTYLILVSKEYRTKYGREIEILENTTKDITALLYAGDYNNDNIINQKDMDAFDGCMANNITNDPQCAKFDLDGNGLSNSMDRNIVIDQKNFNKISDVVYSGIGKITGKIKYDSTLKPVVYYANNSVKEQININSDGSFEINNLPNGVYYIYLDGDSGYTQYSKLVELKGSLNINVTLYAGDLNSDGVINKQDINEMNTFISDYNTDNSLINDPWYKALDFNDDNKIDSKDLEILKNNLGKTAS